MEIVTALCKSVFKKIFLKGTYNWDISGMRMIPPALRATSLFKGGLFFYHVPLEKAPVGCALCWDVPKGQGDIPPALRATSLFKGDKRLLCPVGHLVLSGPFCHLR